MLEKILGVVIANASFAFERARVFKQASAFRRGVTDNSILKVGAEAALCDGSAKVIYFRR